MHLASLRRWLAAITIVAVSGCSDAAGGAAASPRPTAAPTYLLPVETARPGEAVVRPSLVTDGYTRFWLIGFQDGMPSLIGSHAEWPAKGRFARARIVVQNIDRTHEIFEARRQRLIASDGREFPVDLSAQQIKRQPDRIELGSFVRMEFDLYFDVPKDAKVTKLRLFGAPPFGAVIPSRGVEIPLG